MLSQDEQGRLRDIRQHLDHDDPAFTERMRQHVYPRPVPPIVRAPSTSLLAVIAFLSIAAWVAVGAGWSAGLICATIPTALVIRQVRRRPHR